MPHEWVILNYATINSIKRRQCKRCGVIQEYQENTYSLMSGGTWHWIPKAGRCKTTTTQPQESDSQ